MRYILDTHVIIWLALNPQKLSKTAKEIILDINADKMDSFYNVYKGSYKKRPLFFIGLN